MSSTPLPESMMNDLQKDYLEIKALSRQPGLNVDALQTLIKNMRNKLSSMKENDSVITLQGSLWLIQATQHSILEEVHEEENCLREGLKEFAKVEEQNLCFYYKIQGLNDLGQLLINTARYQEAKEQFEESNALYHEFSSKSHLVQSLDSLLDIKSEDEEESPSLLETTNLKTLCALANVNEKLGLLFEGAQICMTILDKELHLKLYDPVEWIEKAIDMVTYLVNDDMYFTARKFVAIMLSLVINEEILEEWKQPRLLARVHVSWGKLCLSILERTEFCNDNENCSNIPPHIIPDPDVMKTPTSEVTSLQEANLIFTVAENAFNKASEYFSLEDHCIDYIEIVLDLCSMLDIIAKKFEDNPKKKYKLYRRQAEKMDPVIKALNPSIYLTESRTLWTRIVDCYKNMLKLKKDSKSRNIILNLAVDNLNQLAQSYTLCKSTDPTEGISALVAYLNLGNLYGQFDPSINNEMPLRRKLEAFKVVKDFCRNNPDSPIITENQESIDEMLGVINEAIFLSGKNPIVK